MVSECLATTISLAEARELRIQASQLLQNLVADRDSSDQRHLEAGKRDPLRLVTGKSALDQAIASAQDVILTMDSVIADITGETAAATSRPADPPVIEVWSAEQRRPHFRRGLRTAINASFRSQAVPVVS